MTRKQPLIPDVRAYLDYHRWLGDAFEGAQQADASLTHRAFAERCGYRSSGAIALIVSGERRISEDAARRIAKALDLGAAERDHLLGLVRFEAADTFEAQMRQLRKLAAAEAFRERWEGTVHAYEYFERWYYPVIRELVSVEGFEEDARWIAQRIHARVRPSEIREAISRLLELGYLQRESAGHLAVAQPILSTPSEVRSELLKQFQRNMMDLAKDALDSQPAEQRDMRVVTMGISMNQARQIKELLTDVQKQVLAIVSNDEPIEVVYQLNTQLFALTNPPEDAE